jgi:hypothetical protein
LADGASIFDCAAAAPISAPLSAVVIMSFLNMLRLLGFQSEKVLGTGTRKTPRADAIAGVIAWPTAGRR